MRGTVQALPVCLPTLVSSLNKREALALNSHFSIMFPVHLVYLTVFLTSIHVSSCRSLRYFFKFSLSRICPIILAVHQEPVLEVWRTGTYQKNGLRKYKNFEKTHKKNSGINVLLVCTHSRMCFDFRPCDLCLWDFYDVDIMFGNVGFAVAAAVCASSTSLSVFLYRHYVTSLPTTVESVCVTSL